MKLLAIIAHPDPASFNHAILNRVREEALKLGHEFRVKDLCLEGFNPVMSRDELREINAGGIPETVRGEQEAVLWADQLIFIYPVWWHDKPAVLRGWIDRVLLQGFAYDLKAVPPKGLLKHRQAFVFMTTGAPEAVCRIMGTKAKMIWAIKDAVLATCGIHQVRTRIFYAVPGADEGKRKKMLEEAAGYLARYLKKEAACV